MTLEVTHTGASVNSDPSNDKRICGCGCGKTVAEIWREGITKNAESVAKMIDAGIIEKWKPGNVR